MINEALCQQAIEYEHQPDGGKTPVVDAYDGCQFRCPYCFQWRDPQWNKDIRVKINLPEVLAQELEGWDPAQILYIGSRSDPYMPLENDYHLTRKILQVALEREIPCILSTKSDEPALLEDIDLFQQFGDKLVMCIGQANMAHLRLSTDPLTLPNIRTANTLIRHGIPTWVFITPVLPGITDVEGMIAALPADTPVYLDKLRLNMGDGCNERFFSYMSAYFPALEERYQALLQTGSDPYYQELKEIYRDNPRVRFVFGEN